MTTKYGSHGTRRSAACLTLIALLTSMMLIAGCAPSPALLASPYDLVAQDAATVSADVRRAIDKLILDANKVAAEQDGKVYVNLKEFERVLIFVPGSERGPDEEDPGVTISGNVTPPENAVFEKWTDTFALAQELTYRYSYVEALAIERHLSPPYFTAEIKLLIKSTQRWAHGGKPQDIPDTPTGFVLLPYHSSSRFGFSGPGRFHHLPAPYPPPGKVVTPSLTIDAISRLALDYLAKGPPKKSKHAVIAQMAYDHLKSRWYLRDVKKDDGFPEPKDLYWSHGLKGDRSRYIYRPSQIQRRKPDDKTATEE